MSEPMSDEQITECRRLAWVNGNSATLMVADDLIAEIERLRKREATIVATLTAMRRDPNGHDANVMLERVLSLFGGPS